MYNFTLHRLLMIVISLWITTDTQVKGASQFCTEAPSTNKSEAATKQTLQTIQAAIDFQMRFVSPEMPLYLDIGPRVYLDVTKPGLTASIVKIFLQESILLSKFITNDPVILKKILYKITVNQNGTFDYEGPFNEPVTLETPQDEIIFECSHPECGPECPKKITRLSSKKFPDRLMITIENK